MDVVVAKVPVGFTVVVTMDVVVVVGPTLLLFIAGIGIHNGLFTSAPFVFRSGCLRFEFIDMHLFASRN